MTTIAQRLGIALRRAGAVAMISALCLAALPIPAGAEDPDFTVLKTLPQTGPLYVDETHRILYQASTNESATAFLMHTYDLDSLKPGKTASFDRPRAAAAPAFRGAGVHMAGTLAAVDAAHGRLYYPGRDANGGLVMWSMDGRTAKTRSYPLPAPPPLAAGAPTTNVTVEALSYEPRGDLLSVLYMIPLASSGLTHTMTGRVVAAELSAADGSLRWATTLDGCNGLPTDAQAMPPFGRSASSLYAVCSAGYSLSQVGFGVLGGDATLAYKIPVAGGKPGTPAVFLSPGSSVRGMFDPRSERILLMRPSVMAVFDGVHQVWVGLVPTDGRPVLGDNASIGRVYLCKPSSVDPVTKDPSGGLAITDAEAAPQPPTATEFPTIGCTSASSTWPIVGDGKTHRVFLPQDNALWAVVKDNVAPYQAPPKINADAGVVDVPESPDKTDSTLSAQAAAYGMRVVAVGGPLGVFDNSASTVAQVIRQNSYQAGLTIGESSRELRFASIPMAKLGKDGVQAAAISADRDDRFEGDLQTVRNYQMSGSNPSGQQFPSPAPTTPQTFSCDTESCTLRNTSNVPRWPYEASTCVAFGDSTDRPESDASVSGSKASCDFRTLALTASAAGPKQTVADLVTVGETSADVRVHRDPKRGVVAHASSVARNVAIAGQVFIAAATATVDSFAGGHRGTASADSYHREFRGVSILGPDKKTEVFKCSTPDECDPAKVIAAINTALGPRIQARMPRPDAELYHGRGSGTASSLRQDSWQQLEERVLYDKPVEDLTMAAFELQINGNLRASSGLIVQLAGVTASSLYQIFLKPEPVILPTLPLPTLPGVITKTVDPGVVTPPEKPRVVAKLVTNRMRTGTKLLIGFNGNPLLILAGWVLLLSPGYIAMRRTFLMRRSRP